MTRTAPTPVRIDCTERSMPQPAPGAWPVTLVWDISSRVCHRFAIADEPDAPVAVELLVTPDREQSCATATLRLVLRSGARRELETRSGVRAVWCRGEGFEHLDAEGVVSCTFRTADTSRPVFARCPLLEQAGIPAGSYSLRSRDD